MNELRLIRRAAGGLALLALLAAALALHTLHAERDAGTPSAGPAVLPIARGARSVEQIDGRMPKSIDDAERAMASRRRVDVTVRRDGHGIDPTLE